MDLKPSPIWVPSYRSKRLQLSSIFPPLCRIIPSICPALTLSGTADGLPTDGDMVTLKFASSGAVTASGKFVTGQDAKGKDVVYSASCSSVLVPEADAAGAGRPPYRVFLYFPPKTGKFEGYADEVSLEWDGAAFEAVRP